MAKKPKPTKTPDLPGVEGPGVSALSIPEIDRAVSKYERKKEARCAVSPEEVAAKRELRAALHSNRAQLPVNEEGNPYYRHDGTDYILEEKLKRRAADDGDVGEADDIDTV
jgi:hypothetical protein